MAGIEDDRQLESRNLADSSLIYFLAQDLCEGLADIVEFVDKTDQRIKRRNAIRGDNARKPPVENGVPIELPVLRSACYECEREGKGNILLSGMCVHRFEHVTCPPHSEYDHPDPDNISSHSLPDLHSSVSPSASPTEYFELHCDDTVSEITVDKCGKSNTASVTIQILKVAFWLATLVFLVLIICSLTNVLE